MRKTVDATSHVAKARVTVGRDFGKELEVLEGLFAGDQVVINTGAISTGQPVEIVR